MAPSLQILQETTEPVSSLSPQQAPLVPALGVRYVPLFSVQSFCCLVSSRARSRSGEGPGTHQGSSSAPVIKHRSACTVDREKKTPKRNRNLI